MPTTPIPIRYGSSRSMPASGSCSTASTARNWRTRPKRRVRPPSPTGLPVPPCIAWARYGGRAPRPPSRPRPTRGARTDWAGRRPPSRPACPPRGGGQPPTSRGNPPGPTASRALRARRKRTSSCATPRDSTRYDDTARAQRATAARRRSARNDANFGIGTLARRAPEPVERAVAAVDRVGRGRLHLGDRGNRAVMLRFRGAELVVLPRRRIGPDHEQIPAAGEPPVAGARGQDRDIAGLELDLAALASAELHARPAPGDPQHLMGPGVVVHVVVDAVAPGAAPAVACEQFLEDRRRVEGIHQPHGAAIDDERPFRIVGHQSVVRQADGSGFSRPHQAIEIAAARLAGAGDAPEGFLEALNEGHGAPVSAPGDNPARGVVVPRERGLAGWPGRPAISPPFPAALNQKVRSRD